MPKVKESLSAVVAVGHYGEVGSLRIPYLKRALTIETKSSVRFEHNFIHKVLNSARPKTIIFPPANSGTSDSNYYPRNTKCMDACPAVFKRGGYNFRLPPLKVRDLRLDLGENS